MHQAFGETVYISSVIRINCWKALEHVNMVESAHQRTGGVP